MAMNWIRYIFCSYDLSAFYVKVLKHLLIKTFFSCMYLIDFYDLSLFTHEVLLSDTAIFIIFLTHIRVFLPQSVLLYRDRCLINFH